MAEYQQGSSRLFSISSSENRDSISSLNSEAIERDKEFYEEIEAPKFVDFTVPDHYCPDDRYWFCDRVGCDQKHEEEMDSEAIYKKFVLRVMAYRSPNVRLQKALDRNALRKGLQSVPLKASKPRLARMAIASSTFKKTANDKDKIPRPISKPSMTPVMKTKPVAAKYLTSPRNKNCAPNRNLFRSVRNHPKSTTNTDEVSKSRTVAKALVFSSPKETMKVKTSVELRTPVSKLCQGMNKLQISVKSSKSLGRSCSSRQVSGHKVQRKAKEPLGSKPCSNQESKSGKSIKSSKIKGKLSQQQESDRKVEELFEPLKSTEEESASLMPPPTQNSEPTLSDDDSKRNPLESENSRSKTINEPENSNISGDWKENVGQVIMNDLYEEKIEKDENMDIDNKENATASDENRMHSNNPKKAGKKILAMHDQCSQVKQKVVHAQYKNLKEGLIASSQVVKLKKSKPTNPKPFRLRTDERRILKEASLEKRNDCLDPPSKSTNSNTLCLKLPRKLDNDIQGLKIIPKGQESSKAAASSISLESEKHQEKKVIPSSPLKSKAMQRLEKFRRTSSLQKHSVRPQGVVSTKNEMTSFLIPGQKLDVIHENFPEVLELKSATKTNVTSGSDADSRLSSHGRRPTAVATGTNLNLNATRTWTKKVK